MAAGKDIYKLRIKAGIFHLKVGEAVEIAHGVLDLLAKKESDGIRQGVSVMEGLWNYFPVDFEDHSIIYMLQETNEGVRELEEAMRVWHDPDRPTEWLGRPEYEHELVRELEC